MPNYPDYRSFNDSLSELATWSTSLPLRECGFLTASLSLLKCCRYLTTVLDTSCWPRKWLVPSLRPFSEYGRTSAYAGTADVKFSTWLVSWRSYVHSFLFGTTALDVKEWPMDTRFSITRASRLCFNLGGQLRRSLNWQWFPSWLRTEMKE